MHLLDLLSVIASTLGVGSNDVLLFYRSYYRCTSSKCSAKKYVEKTTETDTFITTYEGGHNHEMPVKGTARANSSPTPGVLPQRAQ